MQDNLNNKDTKTRKHKQMTKKAEGRHTYRENERQ